MDAPRPHLSMQIPLVVVFYKILPLLLSIWSSGHQALDWSIHSKEVVSSGDNIFRKARLVSRRQQTEDLELSSLGPTWTQIEVTGFEILGGSATEEQGRCHRCQNRSSSHLPILRGVSIAKGAGNHQDQSLMFQVYNVIFFHGHHLGGRTRGEKKGEGDEEREGVGEKK